MAYNMPYHMFIRVNDLDRLEKIILPFGLKSLDCLNDESPELIAYDLLDDWALYGTNGMEDG